MDTLFQKLITFVDIDVLSNKRKDSYGWLISKWWRSSFEYSLDWLRWNWMRFTVFFLLVNERYQIFYFANYWPFNWNVLVSSVIRKIHVCYWVEISCYFSALYFNYSLPLTVTLLFYLMIKPKCKVNKQPIPQYTSQCSSITFNFKCLQGVHPQFFFRSVSFGVCACVIFTFSDCTSKKKVSYRFGNIINIPL